MSVFKQSRAKKSHYNLKHAINTFLSWQAIIAVHQSAPYSKSYKANPRCVHFVVFKNVF